MAGLLFCALPSSAQTTQVKTLHLLHGMLDGQPLQPPVDDPDSDVSQFFYRVSEGRLKFAIREYWGHIPDSENNCDFTFDSPDLPSDALDADYLVYSKGGCQGVDLAYLGSNVSVTQGGVSSHELGHDLGLEHANTLLCRDPSTSAPVSLTPNAQNCESEVRDDPYDVMGNQQVSDLNALHRQQLGWLSLSEMPNISSGDQTFEIGLLDSTAPVKAVSVAGMFSVEYRPPSGVMIHYRYEDHTGDTQIIPAIRKPANYWDPVYDAFWRVGDRFDSPIGNFHVSILSEGLASAQVRVQFGALSGAPAVAAAASGRAVTAVVTQNGSPLGGQTVQFSVPAAGQGSVSPAQATTDASGRAATTFSAAAGFSGSTAVRACLASSSTCADAAVTVAPSPAPVVTIYAPRADEQAVSSTVLFTAPAGLQKLELYDNGVLVKTVSGAGE